MGGKFWTELYWDRCCATTAQCLCLTLFRIGQEFYQAAEEGFGLDSDCIALRPSGPDSEDFGGYFQNDPDDNRCGFGEIKVAIDMVLRYEKS